MTLKAILQKGRSKEALPKVSSEAAIRRCSSKHLCLSLFLIKLQVLWPAPLFKREFNVCVFLWILQKFYEKLFWQKTSAGICRSALLNQKQCGIVSTKKGIFGHSTGYLHISGRNHSNMLLLINLQKSKTCPK